MNAIGLRMCDKCGCHPAMYHIEYDVPDTEDVKRYELCRICQIMMRTTIERCQGMMG